jgi:hypothetical protein
MTESAPTTPPAETTPTSPTPPAITRRTAAAAAPKESVLNRTTAASLEADAITASLVDHKEAKGLFASIGDVLKRKTAWFSDYRSFKALSTKEKSNMNGENSANEQMIAKKVQEIERVKAKIEKNQSRAEAQTQANKAVLDGIKQNIKEAELNNNPALVAVFKKLEAEATAKMATTKMEDLKAEEKALTSALEGYKNRRVVIVDGFIASADGRSERIKQSTNYEQNRERLRSVDGGIDKLTNVINDAGNQYNALKRSYELARGEDKAVIKGAMEGYNKLIKESKVKLSNLEGARTKLSSSIDATDKRISKFEDVKAEYTTRKVDILRENSQRSPTSEAGAAAGASTPETAGGASETGEEGVEVLDVNENERREEETRKVEEALESLKKNSSLPPSPKTKNQMKGALVTLSESFGLLLKMDVTPDVQKAKIRACVGKMNPIIREIKSKGKGSVIDGIVPSIKTFSEDSLKEIK